MLILLLAGCQGSHLERQLYSPESFSKFTRREATELKSASPYLKAHMKNGNSYVLSSWDTDKEGVTIFGDGILFGPMRDALHHGHFTVGLDSIALLETNVIKSSGAITALTIFTGITAAVTVVCLTNPKACFGSCPTFYVSDGDTSRLQAEGFSSSISPSLEATDVDALFRARPAGREVTVEMKNEALETHVVHHVDLLAVPRREGCRVFATSDNRFWESALQLPPASARGPEGDCLSAILKFDNRERFSEADGRYLAAKETLAFQFHVQPDRKYGLVVGCRQTLLPTYLLYQTFACMGHEAGYWLAQIERKDVNMGHSGMAGLIGGIEASVQGTGGSWQAFGQVDEHGPLAADVHLLPLPGSLDTTVNIELRMAKGAWRIDYVALAELSGPVLPIRVPPSSVFREGHKDAEAYAKLIDPDQHLVTLPGDSYTLHYELPGEHADYELFLESRGYYLEWMRKEWMQEQNPVLLAQMFLDPKSALEQLAPEFKHVEQSMEDCFWRSRYAKP